MTTIIIIAVWALAFLAVMEYVDSSVYGPYLDADHPVMKEALRNGELNPFASNIVSARKQEGFIARRNSLFWGWYVSWNGYSQGRISKWSVAYKLLEAKHQELLAKEFSPSHAQENNA